MKISGQSPLPPDPFIQGLQGKGKEEVRPQGEKPGAEEAATVQLSARAREAQKIRQAVDAAPEIREGKVSALKEAIESGTYTVRGELVAEKMLKESLLNLLL